MKNEKDDTMNILESIAFYREHAAAYRGRKDVYSKQTFKSHEQTANWLEELDDRRNDYGSPIEYYGEEGIKDNVKEYKKLCRELAKERKKNKGEESNVECLIIDKITELISKMKLVDVRKLKLFER